MGANRWRIRQFKIAELVWALPLGLLFSLIPMKGPIRGLSPSHIEDYADLENLQPVHLGSNPNFKLAVGGAINLLQRPLEMSDLLDNNTHQNIQLKAQTDQPIYRQNHEIGFSFVTYGEVANCSLELLLNTGQKSQLLSCQEIHDNALAFFTFSQPVLPGIYSASFIWSKLGSGNLGVYSGRDKTGGLWLKPFSQKSGLNTWHLFRDWFHLHKVRACFYLLMLGLVLLFLCSSSMTSISFFGLSFSLYAACCVLFFPFSGHDETAHLTMMHMAVTDKAPDDVTFNRSALKSLINSDFFRLHEAHFPKDGECPHAVLRGCGVSEGPMRLYRFYANVLKRLGIIINGYEPEQLLWVGRLINIFRLICFSIFICLLLGKHSLFLLAFYLISEGGYLAQFPSLSNDPPLFLYGLFLALGFSGLLRGTLKLWQRLIFICLAFVLFFAARDIDRSAIAALPLICTFPFVFALTYKTPSSKELVSLKQTRWKWVLVLVSGVVTFGAVGSAGMYWKDFSRFSGLPVLRIVNAISNDAGMMENLSSHNMATIFAAISVFAKSFLGSFVWGHTYFPDHYYALILGALFVLTLRGLAELIATWDVKVGSLLAVVFGGLIAVYFLIVLLVLPPDLKIGSTEFGGFLKVRLTAPGSGILLVLPGLGFLSFARSSQARHWLYRFGWIWVCSLLIYYMPQIFLLNLY